MRHKFIAFDQDKCQFVYHLARATRARNVAEVGTGFGVSTIYLAWALGGNIEASGGEGTVHATEQEVQRRRERNVEGGILLKTLKDNVPVLDLVLIDIWAPVALQALKLLEPKMRSAGVVLLDNSVSSAARYAELLAYLRSLANGYTNLALTYSKG
ncbi:hypothetical protein LOCC1_G007328 [Lachnellula occidentalis]|uniref:O-methyltransferase n=1 Tax=Lachnellula occidentalis TaxID=215460 RepID=A0A8H8RRE7_9HELO|nr:hypothetical protein LOCC1_G007328 [Lachnellula occidentalis]